MKRLGVLVSGAGSNLQAILEATRGGVLAGVAEVAVVISSRAEAGALERAQAAGVTTRVVQRREFDSGVGFDEALSDTLRAHTVDIVCLAGFAHLIGPVLLRAFPRAILNIHPALLPSFPGREAQRQALEHGVKVTGPTVHLVDEGIDTGPIILQASVPVRDDDDVESLRERILVQEHRLYPEAIRLLAQNRLVSRGRRVTIRP